MAVKPGNTQFSITLSNQAVEMIEVDLVPTGLYGNNRAEVSRALILTRLEQLAAEGIVQIRRVNGQDDAAANTR